ncbi:VOC family protein [Microvirga makkahensis]|uniref:Glyoxalase-like domain-containing protein n=1 Tax=Microvirga makkahensis TaxID=1128670 RepID=A0A7X3MX80_9HYPH|nr:VOC family protein [Microvirga makkahensis]MXQ14698.1 hypothetical protein [Microvirga makkahensis]
MAERIRLRQICLLTDRLEPLIDTLIAVFGLQVCHGKADLTRYGVPYEEPPAHSAAFFSKHGLASAQLPIGDTFLELVAPTRHDTPAGRYLNRRGGGGYMVITEVEQTDPFLKRVEDHGVRLAGVVDYPTYHELQLDPRDIGASILSFSSHKQDEPFDGQWYPAGAHWRDRVQPGYRAIRSAELACADPARTARQWAAVIGRDAIAVGDALRIPLDDSEVRFVHDLEGRGDRLDAIYIEADDFSTATRAAREAGLVVSDGAIVIGGLKFREVSSDGAN